MSGENILLPEVWGEKILMQTHEITYTPGDEVVLPSDIALATPIFDSALPV